MFIVDLPQLGIIIFFQLLHWGYFGVITNIMFFVEIVARIRCIRFRHFIHREKNQEKREGKEKNTQGWATTLRESESMTK